MSAQEQIKLLTASNYGGSGFLVKLVEKVAQGADADGLTGLISERRYSDEEILRNLARKDLSGLSPSVAAEEISVGGHLNQGLLNQQLQRPLAAPPK